ncbi:MAG: amino acid permease [Blastocatellia bacterium]|nr:amino acid permease [Blastocatellia bacterium]MBN8722026.1 amino acid permease [Acidobacteriota bacterium]
MKKIGLFDTTMIVMGGIIGSGIFINPYVVARQVNTPTLILSAWAVGGLIALLGAFIYSELASRLPNVGGQYAYLKEAFHPIVAFIYGWTMLLVIQTGGMAAVAMTFARYFIELTNINIKEGIIAVASLAFLTLINCLGLRAGSLLQSILMVLKILAILALILLGLLLSSPSVNNPTNQPKIISNQNEILAFAAAMTPVLFAYGGWQTASFISGEVDNVRKTLPRALIIGVMGVVILYLGVNYVCISVLGTAGLASSTTPASAVMTNLLGQKGAKLIAIAITISTFGYLSQSMLTAPRVYFAMATDKLFFQQVAWIDPVRNVPSVAIILQGFFASVIALSGQYEEILNYVVSTDFIFFGLVALCLFRLQSKQKTKNNQEIYKMPAHPFSTIIFMLACWTIVLSTIYKYPLNSLIGIAIMLLAIPVYFFWKGKQT